MFKKFIAFIGDLLLIVVVSGAIILFSQSLITSEHVNCELQQDQLYTCNTEDVIFGLKVSGVTAEKVYDIDYDLKCSKSSKARGCVAYAAFQIEGSEPTLLSKRYKNPDQVQKMVNILKPLMAEKDALIDMSFPPSTFSIILVILFEAIFGLLILFRAFENLMTN
jgi:hypothetical protein